MQAKKPKLAGNRLKAIRTREGLSRTHLARLADLSEKTVKRMEMGVPVTPVSRHRIVNALNQTAQAARRYTFADIFPDDAEI